MKKQLKTYLLKATCFLLFVCLLLSSCYIKPNAKTNPLSLTSKSFVLMESSTGTIIYAQNEHEKLPPASITKIMTLLLIFEAIDSGQIKLTDEVITSEHAESMGGSNVYLEENEIQTVETMIKCITVASANDAAVAMAEHLCGSEQAFVDKMNAKAAELGMNDTHFVNACGLDVKGHVSSAHDIAIMSRALTLNHPSIFYYTTIWMDSFDHVTKRGTQKFDLANTNKLLKQYPYATGLKTGYTSLAKHCLSATATKEHVSLIAVILCSPDSKTRFSEAKALLEYGFSNCKLYTDKTKKRFSTIDVLGGQQDKLKLLADSDFSYVETKGRPLSEIKTLLDLPKVIKAPIKKGQPIGSISYYLGEEKIGSIKLYAANSIPKQTLLYCFIKIIYYLLPI